jgi:hypothetical protein
VALAGGLPVGAWGGGESIDDAEHELVTTSASIISTAREKVETTPTVSDTRGHQQRAVTTDRSVASTTRHSTGVL